MINTTGELIHEIDRLNRKEAKKWAITLHPIDKACFLADYGEEFYTPNLWTLTNDQVTILLLARIDSHPEFANGLGTELIEWVETMELGG